MFLIGDKVVHPMHGAGVIERITHLDQTMGGWLEIKAGL